ncbi:MAG TPA: DUF3300 domain-containing protein [Burkholderiales bacterium]|nr:DUF3300 domain-containing protein [Burkholderiales bacterium]
MKTFFKSWIGPALALLFSASIAGAQDRVPFRQEELDQMLAPVALYPDSLLSQVLMASTYPLEVVQAARWSRANPGLKGQDAARAVANMDWDPSVKSLAAFPQVLRMMDEKLEWTERLGEAFLAQQGDVMDSVQALRRRAEAAGNLQSNEHMRVERQRQAIVIEPPAPDVVYVPHYSPAVVYGPWWWPAYPPVFWAPPVYYAVPAFPHAFAWGPGIAISAGFFFGHADWHRRHVTVVNNHFTNVTVNRTVRRANITDGSRTVWRHDPAHRRGVPFRTAEARQRIAESRNEAGAGRGGNDARGARSGGIDRLADIRQRRFDERRAPDQVRGESRVDSRGGGRSGVERVMPSGGADRADRATGRRNDATVRGGAPRDSRTGQPEALRQAAPPRPRPETRSQRAERPDRRGDVSRLQGGRRAEAHGTARRATQHAAPMASALAPRRAASTPHGAPRMESRTQRSNLSAGARHNGAGRARAAGRNNGRGF